MRPSCHKTSHELPEEVVHVQCLGCGAELSARRSGLVRCRHCGGLDFHVVNDAAHAVEAPLSTRSGAPDNRQVIDRLMALVDAVYSGHMGDPH